MKGEAILFCRLVATLAMTLWLGGFTFYGGIVVPILEDELGSYEAGMITRRVTSQLNLIGLATVSSWAGLGWVERRRGSRGLMASRLSLLLVTSILLGVLACLHVVMDRHLERQGVIGFRPLHRLYLIVSTGQWLVNLALVWLSLRIWTVSDARTPSPVEVL